MHNQLPITEAQGQWCFVTPQDNVIDELWCTYQIGHSHTLIALQIKTKMMFSNRVTPLQEHDVIHDDNTVRQQGHRLTKAC